MWMLAWNAAYSLTLENGELSGIQQVVVPNTTLAPPPPDGWTLIDGAVLVGATTSLDCADFLGSFGNDAQFVRAVESFGLGYYGDVQQGLQTEVSGLEGGMHYLVRFDQALVRNAGQSPGYWELTLGASDGFASPIIALPAVAGRTEWQRVVVGPILHPAGSAAVLRLVARSTLDVSAGNQSALTGTGTCPYGPTPEMTDLLIDNIEMVRDADVDGLGEDEELALGTSDLTPDTDGDGLLDRAERDLGLDPVDPDPDGDGLLDGDELAYGTDPFVADTDLDGLLDGEEIALGTDPVLPDTDFDGLLDGEEVLAESDPLDPGDPPAETTVPTTDTRPRGSAEDLGKGGAVGCACAQSPRAGGLGGLVWGGLLPLWRLRRRATQG